ncbi:MAG: hypothetical protein HY903_11060 [Deltaproteobacteria bacterium]|nr:hypothetical protein [Deltaproteobacteria bacterium]
MSGRGSWALVVVVALAWSCSGDHSPPVKVQPGDFDAGTDPGPHGDGRAGDSGAAGDAVVVPSIEWARLQHPESHSGETQSTVVIYGRVFKQGITDGAGRGQGVTAEGGLGSAADPVAAWAWAPAAFNVDVDNGANDEYQLTLTLPAVPGTYRYAFRFALYSGPWVYADLGAGTSDGFAIADSGTLTVTPPPVPAVDWCRLEGPPAQTLAPGAASVATAASVYEAGVTDGGAPTSLVGELGVGPRDSTPDELSWTWSPLSFGRDDGNNDVFAATFVAPGVLGPYDFAARFKLASGGAWLLCDRDGSALSGYTAAQAGKLTVAVVTDLVDWGVLRPPAVAFETGGARPEIEIEIYKAGVTDAAGQGPGIEVQVGVGPPATDPTIDAGGWQLEAAGYARDAQATSNDVYVVALPALAAGHYAYAARASLDAGAHWLWLDTDEVTMTFDPAKLGDALVSAPVVDWVRIVTPPDAARVSPGAPIGARVQIYEAGSTPGGGQGAGIEVQVGVGPRGADPSTVAWSYSAAQYARDVDGGGVQADDQYDWRGVAPVIANPYDLAARARLNGGPWLIADTSGSAVNGDPYQASLALNLDVVTPAAGAVVDWCRLLPAPSKDLTLGRGEAAVVYGQVHAALASRAGSVDLTGPAGAGPTPLSQVGYGPPASMPTAGDWSWGASGVFNLWPASSVNDEHLAILVAPDVPGTYDWAWRFSMDGGTTWLCCDADGAMNLQQYAPAEAGSLTVTAP